MKPDSMLVEPEMIRKTLEFLREQGGSANVFGQFAAEEPALASYLHEALAGIAGKLALSGVPTQLVQELHEEMLSVSLASLLTLRRGHYELWKGTILGNRLLELLPSFEPPVPTATDAEASTGSKSETNTVEKSRRAKRRRKKAGDGQAPRA
jgi:hypothetical protein